MLEIIFSRHMAFDILFPCNLSVLVDSEPLQLCTLQEFHLAVDNHRDFLIPRPIWQLKKWRPAPILTAEKNPKAREDRGAVPFSCSHAVLVKISESGNT